MWKLVIEDDEGKRTVVPLTRDDYSIGRKEGNTIRLTERNVSREHAKLSRRNGIAEQPAGMYILEDLTSYNGVYVNGLRVAHSQDLAHGDLIQIGDYRIILQDDTVSEAPTTAVPASDPKSTQPGARASQMMDRPNRLVMLVGPTPGAEFPLEQERMTVGRAEDANISINHNSVSRLHCEVHALGDGRYEIVDKGSSNGVRVNYSDLRRGIIEAGDVIELGDVKFKFVGAGQIFRAGASESQVLTAIGERTASAIVGTPRRSSGSALPYVIFGLVVAAGAGGAWLITHPPKTDGGGSSSVSLPPTDTIEQKALDEATKQCHPGDCDVGHKLANDALAKDSPLRQSKPFKDIENTWADSMLDRADQEPDIVKKKVLLHEVETATTVDDVRRNRANDQLKNLEMISSPNPSQLPLATLKDGGLTEAAPYLRDAGARRAAIDATAPTTTIVPTASTAKPATTGTDATERDRNLMLNDNFQQAQKDLETRVYGGKGTSDDARMLKAICKKNGNKSCVDTCNRILGQ